MNSPLISILCLSALAMLTSCSENTPTTKDQTSEAASPIPGNRDQAFTAAFREALEKKDTKAMDALILKDGTPAEILEFFTMMLDLPDGMKVESVELVTPGEQEAAKYRDAMEMPDGKSYKLPLKPVKTLVLVLKEDGPNGNGTSKSTLPVAEKDGKLVILMPVPAV